MSALGIFQIDIQKQLGGEYWTNRYHVEVATLEGALAIGQQVAEEERQSTISTVTFVSVRASVPGAENDDYIVQPLGYNGGTVTADPGLPLFVVARVIFSKGPGRPDVKYYKAMANIGAIADPFTWNQNFVTGLNTALCAELLEITPLVSADGTAYTSIQLDRRIGMRQLRRGSKKKETPIIPVE